MKPKIKEACESLRTVASDRMNRKLNEIEAGLEGGCAQVFDDADIHLIETWIAKERTR